MLRAGGQQVFRVQYVGEPELASSQIFYLSIKQIPVELAPGPPQVQVVVNFNVLVNVVPEGTRPEPVIESVAAVVRENVPGVEIRVANRGTRYFAMSDVGLTLTGKVADGSNATYERSAAEVGEIVGIGVIAPGRSRIFFIPTEQPLIADTIRVSLDS